MHAKILNKNLQNLQSDSNCENDLHAKMLETMNEKNE